MKLPDHFQKRVGMTTVGVIFCALAVGFFKCSSFGVDPFQCFAQGTWERLFGGVTTYGVYYMILSGVMLVLDLFIARSYMGVATLVNMFLTGYIVDFAVWVLQSLWPEPGLALRVEGRDGHRAGLGRRDDAGEVDAGGGQVGAEEVAEGVGGDPAEEAGGGTEPGERHCGVGRSAAWHHAQGELAGAWPAGVGEGVGDALAEDGDRALGHRSAFRDQVGLESGD